MRVKNEINVQTGERIRAAREGAKLTQEQLAERIEVSPQYISDLERGIVGISLPTLKRLCLAVGVSSDRILFGAEPERSGVLTEKCRNLTPEQFKLLSEIVDRFVQAVASEKE